MIDTPDIPNANEISDIVKTAENTGTAALRQGDIKDATSVFQELLNLDPRNAIALNGLGQICLHNDDHSEAEKFFKNATTRRPDWAEPYIHLAGMYLQQNRLPRTRRMLRRAHDCVGEDVDMLYLLSRFHHRLGDMKSAQSTLEAALMINPNHADVCNDLASIYALSGNLTQAETLFRTAVNSGGDSLSSRLNLGRLLVLRNELTEAAEFFQEILTQHAENVGALIGLASVKRRTRDLAGALLDAERAASLDPENEIALNLIGIIYRELGDFDAAQGAFSDALAKKPDDASARSNLGMLTLLQGDWAAGWDDYESRLRTADTQKQWGEMRIPFWNGGDLAGKNLIVFSEQGFGDSLQFCRFLPEIAKSAEHVLFAVQPELSNLLREQLPGVHLISPNDTIDSLNVQAMLLSLPKLLGVNTAKHVKGAPYLKAPENVDLVKHIAALSGLKVGLNWLGNPAHKEDAKRSLSFNDLAPLLDLPNISWINLALGAETSPNGLVDVRAHLNDFADTASLMANLDLIVSVDTATVHLAGALGVPCWTLLSKVPDWRWGLTGETTPWYDTMRLWRQDNLDDWTPVIAEIASALSEKTNA